MQDYIWGSQTYSDDILCSHLHFTKNRLVCQHSYSLLALFNTHSTFSAKLELKVYTVFSRASSSRLCCCLQGSDVREGSLGCIFGYSAIIRSGRAQKDESLASKLAEALLALLQSKSFLGEVSAAALLDLLEQLDESAFTSVLESVPGLKGMLQSPAESATPEVHTMPIGQPINKQFSSPALFFLQWRIKCVPVLYILTLRPASFDRSPLAHEAGSYIVPYKPHRSLCIYDHLQPADIFPDEYSPLRTPLT